MQRLSLERDSAQNPTTDQPDNDTTSNAAPSSPLAGRFTTNTADQATLDERARRSSDAEVGSARRDASLRNPKSSEVRTVRTDYINKKSTVRCPSAREYAHLHLPDRFEMLRPEQQSGALIALLQLAVDIQQPVLDEWTARCHASAVRNPAAYLFGLIQRALRGEFHAWAGHHPIKPSGPSMPESKRTADAPTHPSPETAAFVTELRNRMRIP